MTLAMVVCGYWRLLGVSAPACKSTYGTDAFMGLEFREDIE